MATSIDNAIDKFKKTYRTQEVHEYMLLQDIVIPAGTMFGERTDAQIVNANKHYQAMVDLSDGIKGRIVLGIIGNDPSVKQWFVEPPF